MENVACFSKSVAGKEGMRPEKMAETVVRCISTGEEDRVEQLGMSVEADEKLGRAKLRFLRHCEFQACAYMVRKVMEDSLESATEIGLGKDLSKSQKLALAEAEFKEVHREKLDCEALGDDLDILHLSVSDEHIMGPVEVLLCFSVTRHEQALVLEFLLSPDKEYTSESSIFCGALMVVLGRLIGFKTL